MTGAATMLVSWLYVPTEARRRLAQILPWGGDAKERAASADGSFETLILCVDPEVLVLGTVTETLPP